MSKRRKKKRPVPNLSPSLFLRSRLDTLWSNEALSRQDNPAIEGDLDAIARGIEPDFLLQTILRAYLSTPVPSRARLDTVLPDWLRKRNYLETLEQMITDQSLDSDLHQQALAWLEGAGRDTKSLTSTLQDLFCQAFYYGDRSQAMAAIFWYTHPKKNRAQGFSFLIDHNPPWDGAIKDVFLSPRRSPKDLIQQFVDTWAEGGMVVKPISAGEVKTKILTALGSNRASKIRLPRDLITNRELFIRQVLSLPNTPGTPAFTADDFDFLSESGEPPEKIMRFEQTVGRRIRLEDGKEAFIVGGPDWDDEE